MENEYNIKIVKELTATDRIVNRHKARLLTELEQVNCPKIYVDAVKTALNWLRSDLNNTEDIDNERRILQETTRP